MLLSYMLGMHEYSHDEINVISRLYDASLIDLDQAINILLERLRKIGILDNTVVVITSDHGENLGDHRMMDHKYCVYNTLIRVPLIIRYPPAVLPGRVESPVPVLDLFATILDLAGLPEPGPEIPSRSLFAGGRSRSGLEPIFSELVESTPKALQRVSNLYPNLDWKPWLRTLKSVEQGNYKFIQASDGRHELYNLALDAGEEHNLMTAEPERVEAMKRSIQQWLTTFAPYDPSQASKEDKPRRLSKDVLKELRSLGYFN